MLTSARRAGLTLSATTLAAAFLILLALTGLFWSSTSAFNTDEAIYMDMARSMFERGTLWIADNGGVEAAPALQKQLTLANGSLAMPQYPSGYAILAAPFYALFGVKGLIGMNVLAGLVVLAMTWRIALSLYEDRSVAWLATGLLGFATFLPTYMFAVWPHAISLALILCGVERTIAAAREGGSAPMRNALLAGLLFGLAVNIRVDAFVSALAVWFWLRLFGAPSRRGLAMLLILGTLPGLALAAGLNQYKFGMLSPFSYGVSANSGPGGVLSTYMPVMILAASAALAAILVDTNRPAIRQLVSFAVSRRGLALIGAGAVLAVVLIAPLRDLIQSVFVLAVDVHSRPEHRWREGMVRLDNGLMSFWGLHKRALLQSAPVLVLGIVAGLVALVRGERVRAHALCVAMAASIMLLYSLNQWGGGMSFSMRYFLPAVPFLCILTAYALHWLWRCEGGSLRAIRLSILCVGVAILAWPSYAQPFTGRIVEFILMALVAVAAGVTLWHPRPPAAAAALVVSSLAIGLSATNTVTELTLSQAHRHARTPFELAYERSFAPGDLVATYVDRFFTRASVRGVHAINPTWTDAPAAVTAFIAAGRCVYLHKPVANDFFADEDKAAWIDVILPGLSGEMAGDMVLFQTPAVSADRCASEPRFVRVAD